VLIAWNDAFSIDAGAIDADHRFLVDRINRIIGEVQTNDYNLLCKEFADLRSFAAKHFAREETLQQASGYPKRAEHEREHKDMLFQLNRVVELVRKPQHRAMPAEKLRAKMYGFLYSWLLSHIMTHDLKMKPYVQKMREAAKGLAALHAA